MDENPYAAHNENVKTAWKAGREEAKREIVADLRREAERYENRPMGFGVAVGLLKMADRYEQSRHLEE